MRGEDDPGLRVARQVTGTTPAIDSSSVILVRDRAGQGGLELLMLERHVETDFAGGALVFPGGKVETQDRELDPARVTGADAEALARTLGSDGPGDGLGLAVAAVREAFEESGILLARAGSPGGALVGADRLASEAFVVARRRLASRDDPYDWRPFLSEEGLVLDLSLLGFFAWWATPDGLHRRFDTRFFVAHVPAAQAEGAGHDDVEMTSAGWYTPDEALAAGRERRATVIYPTRKLLQALAGYDSAAALVDAARAGDTDRRRLQPRIVEVDGRSLVQHPDGGDPEPG